MTGPDSTATGTSLPGSTDAEPVGSVAEEAFKLFRAMASPAASAPVGDDGSTHVCTTAWCPVCQVVGFVRDNPDAIASVTRSATDLARSLRDLVETALTPEEKK